MWYHPKYYKELRKRNKAARIPPTSSGQAASDQAISEATGTPTRQSVRPGPGLKPQATEASSLKPKRQAKRQASSIKPAERQASSD